MERGFIGGAQELSIGCGNSEMLIYSGEDSE